jgi:centriolar protein POC1
MINTFVDHESGVNSVKFHPDGTCVASGSQDRTIKIWDIRSQRLIQHYDAHSGDVTEIGFHPNGRYLLSSSNDSTLKIWDLRQGHILYTLYGHEGASTSAAFSPCGDYFTTGGQDSVVMVWKSNLEEIEQEFIEDFGAKAGPGEAPGVPKAKAPIFKRPGTGAAK